MAKKLSIVAAALVAIIAIVLFSLIQSADTAWLNYLSELRTAGEPLTYEEIEARRSRDPEGGPTIADVAARVAGKIEVAPGPISRGVLGMSDGPSIDFFEGIPRDAIETTRAYLAPRLPILDELGSVHNLPPGRFPISYVGPPIEVATRFIESSPPIHRLTQILLIDATIKLIDGNTEAAADRILGLLDVVKPLEQEPASMALMRRCATAFAAVRLLEDALRVGTLSDAALVEIDADFNEFLSSHTLKWALWADRATFIGQFDQMRSSLRIPGVSLFLMTRDQQIRGVRFYNRFIHANDAPAKLLTAIDEVSSELPQLDTWEATTLLGLSGVFISVSNHLECLGEVRAARAAIAAERYRLVNDALPMSIDQLAPGFLGHLPADPFDQSPLKMEATEKGVVIYSIGRDQKDDGGAVVSRDRKKPAPDCGFRLFEAQHRGLVLIDQADSE